MNIQVFISYKRAFSFPYALLLHDRLKARLNCRVFMDLSSIGPGNDFVESTERAESSCSVVLVLIAREWLLVDERRGIRPVDDPKDWQRQEVAAALRQKTRIIPILLNDASMPAEADLPADISSLARHQAITIRDSVFDHDFERLISVLEDEIGREPAIKMRTLAPNRLADDVVYYFPHLLKLIVMPKRYIRAFTANREEELTRATSFLLISLLIYTIFSAPLFIDKKGMIVLLLVQFFMMLVLTFCSSAILQLSWRFVGGNAPFSRYHSINSYYCGVSSVLTVCLIAAGLGVLRISDPHMLELLRKAARGDISPLIAARPARSVPLRVVAWTLLIGNLLLLVWTYVFWGAYREINKTTRFYSFMAFCISCVIYIPVGIFFVLIQEGLLNLFR